MKNWNILQANWTLSILFPEQPIIDFKRNRNIKESTGSSQIENSSTKKFNIITKRGKCSPFLSWTKNQVCNQVETRTTFISQQANRTVNIFFKYFTHPSCYCNDKFCFMLSIIVSYAFYSISNFFFPFHRILSETKSWLSL